jgi:hypothetical protein
MYYAIKAYRGVDVQIHIFLTLALGVLEVVSTPWGKKLQIII